jgi:anti-sigma regulatory factor (Ser/Thr protein kinase)
MWGNLYHRFEATPSAPKAARRRVSDWLHLLGWTGPECDDVVIAVSEAITNAVEHAYPRGGPGTVTVDATTLTGPHGTQRIRITVIDEGCWRAPCSGEAPAGSPPPVRGLSMIRTAMSHVSLEANATGTRLTMITEPAVPATPAPSSSARSPRTS